MMRGPLLDVLAAIEVGVAEPAAAADGLAAVLGRPARASSDGRFSIPAGNIAIRVRSRGGGPVDGRAALGLVFSASDLGETARRLARRAVPGVIDDGKVRLQLDHAATQGVPIEVEAAADPAVRTDAGHDIAGLDHVVVRTPDPERAVALYGGRLGLDLRLDRVNAAGNRLLFFVCGDLVVEVSHDPGRGTGAGPDSIYGLAWRAGDIERAHRRMSGAGIDVSEVREGRRPGTHVFTVRSHVAGIPTLVIGGQGLVRT